MRAPIQQEETRFANPSSRTPPPHSFKLKAGFFCLAILLALQACTSVPQAPSTFVSSARINTDRERPDAAEPISIDSLFAACPTADEIAYIDSRTEIVFLADPSAPQLVCSTANGSGDLSLLQKNVYNIFILMQRITFDLPLPWTDLSLLDWFTQAVKGVVFDSQAEFTQCCDKAHRIVIQTDYLLASQTGMWIDSNYGAGVYNLMSTLIHEARHGEGYIHACLRSLGGDLGLHDMGAWAVEYYFDLWIADHTPKGLMPEFYREFAQANADLILGRRFCGYEDP